MPEDLLPLEPAADFEPPEDDLLPPELPLLFPDDLPEPCWLAMLISILGTNPRCTQPDATDTVPGDVRRDQKKACPDTTVVRPPGLESTDRKIAKPASKPLLLLSVLIEDCVKPAAARLWAAAS